MTLPQASKLKPLGLSLTFFVALLIYLWGISPSIYWRDSAEFVTVVHGLGISHPAGSPAYSLFAKPFTWLPFGSIAFRINLFSALMGALTVSLLFGVLYDLLVPAQPWVRFWAALSGAAFLMISESFWRFAEVAEVYTLQEAVLVLLLGLLLAARRRRITERPAQVYLYYLFAFLYGVSAGIHVTMALFAPAFLIFMAWTEPRLFWGQRLALLTFFFLLGFSVYLYLPLRSLTNPAYDWGDPQSWRQFLIHLSDRKDSKVHEFFPWSKLPYQGLTYLHNLTRQFALFGIALGLLGGVACFVRDRRLGCLLLLVFLGNVGFFIRIWSVAFGFLPSFVIFAIWIGFGVHAGLEGVARLYRRGAISFPRWTIHTVLAGGIVATLCVSFIQHIPAAKQTGNYSAELYGRQLLDQLPAYAVVFIDYSWFLLQYLQQVEQRRPDVSVVLRRAVLSPEFYTPLSSDRFPNLRLSDRQQPQRMTTEDYFWYLATINASDHALFMEPESGEDVSFSHLLPVGLLYRFYPSEEPELTPRVLKAHWQSIRRARDATLSGALDQESVLYFLSKVLYISDYLESRGLVDEAIRTLRFGLEIQPDNYHVLIKQGKLLMTQRRFKAALAHFNAAYNANPMGTGANKILGIFLLQQGKYREALRYLHRARRLGLVEGDLYSLLAGAYIQLRDYAKAKRALQTALSLYTEKMRKEKVNYVDDFLTSKMAWIRQNLQLLDQGATEQLIPMHQEEPKLR